MTTREELTARAANIVEAVRALQGRLLATQHFGTPEELEEVGFLTLRFAGMEETIALYCEVLLFRPELSGFHPSAKLIPRKQFSDKISLFTGIMLACGTLYDII